MVEPTNGIVKSLQDEISRLQKKLQEARAACDLYENELIALRKKIDNTEVVRPLDTEKHILPIISLIVDTATYYPYEDKSYMVESIVDPLYTVDSIQEAVERIIAEHPGRENIIKYNDKIIVNTARDIYELPIQTVGNLNIASDDDTQEVDVEPVDSRWIPRNDALMTWQGFIHELDNEDDA